MPRIIVSAGHTNRDPGTIVDGVREVDLTRKIAKAVTKELRQEHIITLAVPPDLDLARRIEWINQTGYTSSNNDISIEIHINDGNKQGIEGWYQADTPNSKELTEYVLQTVSKDLSWTNQGAKSEYSHPFGSLAFLHNTNPIASLVECGYLDNENDRKFLSEEENITKLAKAIASGILSYIKKEDKTNGETTNSNQGNDTKGTNIDVSNTQTPSANQASSNINQFNPTAGTQTSDSGMGLRRSSPPTSFPTTSPTPYTPPASQNKFSSFGNQGGTAPGSNNSTYMNRDDRKEMIQTNYIKILGREPTQSDLNYFLNTGITEDKLIEKMINSQEHADLVKSRQEVIKTKKQFVDQKNELLSLRAQVNDQKGIIKNLNSLLMQKNKAIFDIQQKIKAKKMKEEQKKEEEDSKVEYEKSFVEKMLEYFSKKLG